MSLTALCAAAEKNVEVRMRYEVTLVNDIAEMFPLEATLCVDIWRSMIGKGSWNGLDRIF